MKIWCETCSGFGRVGNYLEDYDCPNCEGEGFTENTELEAKATKWDMIEWAVDNVITFVECEVNGVIWHTCILGTELEKLEKVYKERQQKAIRDSEVE